MIHYHILTPFLRFQPPNQSGQFTTKPSVWIYQRKNPLHQLLSPFSRPKIIVSHSNEQMGVKPRERERAWPRVQLASFSVFLLVDREQKLGQSTIQQFWDTRYLGTRVEEIPYQPPIQHNYTGDLEPRRSNDRWNRAFYVRRKEVGHDCWVLMPLVRYEWH